MPEIMWQVMELQARKTELRRRMASLKKAYTEAQLRQLSDKITNRLEESPFFRNASCVAIYHALPGEVQTAAFLERWYRQKELLLPLVKGDNLLMVPYKGRDAVAPGAFGILEPCNVEDAVQLSSGRVDLVVVPGVAFDRNRNRLGRGKGVYDRLLSGLPVFKAGLCFGFQLVDDVPVSGVEDIPMDAVITEDEVVI